MKIRFSDRAIFACGLGISILAVLAMPELYFHKDLETFWKWANDWNMGWSNIYLACQDCNYPILGMYVSAGWLNWLSPLGFGKSVQVYRILLGLIDGINVLLIYVILRMLRVERALFIAGIIGISICTWVGGALWGQIDGVSQFMILCCLAWIIYKNTTSPWLQKYYLLYVCISSILLACLILVKQLVIFSAFTIGLLLVVDLFYQLRLTKSLLWHSFAGLAVFIATIFLFDPFLGIKKPYFSHLIYIWKEGVFQSGIISGNGFNIWMLLGRDMWSSAHTPFVEVIPALTPYTTGMGFFVVFVALVSITLLKFIIKKFSENKLLVDREVILNFILHLALINLGMNIFMTGTRERYLVHFFPFIMIAFSGLRKYSPLFSEKLFSIVLLGSSIYGFFVLQILSTIDFGLGTSTHKVMAILFASLLVFVSVITFKYYEQKRMPNPGEIMD